MKSETVVLDRAIAIECVLVDVATIQIHLETIEGEVLVTNAIERDSLSKLCFLITKTLNNNWPVWTKRVPDEKTKINKFNRIETLLIPIRRELVKCLKYALDFKELDARISLELALKESLLLMKELN